MCGCLSRLLCVDGCDFWLPWRQQLYSTYRTESYGAVVFQCVGHARHVFENSMGCILRKEVAPGRLVVSKNPFALALSLARFEIFDQHNPQSSSFFSPQVWPPSRKDPRLPSSNTTPSSVAMTRMDNWHIPCSFHISLYSSQHPRRSKN